MKKICLLLVFIMFILCACHNTETSRELTTVDYRTVSIEDLSEEQIEYLTDELGLSREDISETAYESLNCKLLGTGLELYNPSSGVEKYGITYELDSTYDYTSDSKSEKKITMDEVYSIRAKEKNIRIEDVKGYEYTVEKDEKGYYKLFAPIENYEKTSLLMTYRINADGTIKMLVPYLVCGDEKMVFSIYYDQAYFKAYYENGDYSYENKVFYGVQYSSVTKKGLVLQLYNCKDKDYSYKGDLVICDINGKEVMKIEVDYYLYRNMNTIYYVEFTKELPAGKYSIVIGNDYAIDFELK